MNFSCFRSGAVSIIIVLALFRALPGVAAEISIDSVSLTDNVTEVQVPVKILLSGGELVSGLNMGVAFDPSVLSLNQVLSGASTIEANKTLSFKSPVNGRLNIVIYSMTPAEILQNGTIATLVFQPVGQVAGNSETELKVSECVLSDSKAESVNVNANGGTLTFKSSATDNGGTESGSSGSSGCFIKSCGSPEKSVGL